VIQPRGVDRIYGSQLEQIIGMVKLSVRLWTHPLLLPSVLLQNYFQRTEMRTRTLERQLIKLENDLGVTFACGAGLDLPQDDWPEYIDVKNATIGLHSTMPQIIFMERVCDWAKGYGFFILELDKELCQEHLLNASDPTAKELRECVLFAASSNDCMRGFFQSLRKRAQTQINVVSVRFPAGWSVFL
jgi:hypothetical protein